MAHKIGVIIPAAGAGRRLGGVTKPLIEVGGKPIILRLLHLFSRQPDVYRICVAAPRAEIADFRRIGDTSGIKVSIVEGGSERAVSVKNAYDSLSDSLSEEDLVCIHDAARPLLSEEDLASVISVATKFGAAFLAARVKDTLKLVGEGGVCLSTIDRTNLFAAQTPQVMKSAYLKRAYSEVGDYSGITDEIMLMEKIGVGAVVVEPRRPNLKLTSPEDLDLIMNLIDLTS